MPQGRRQAKATRMVAKKLVHAEALRELLEGKGEGELFQQGDDSLRADVASLMRWHLHRRLRFLLLRKWRSSTWQSRYECLKQRFVHSTLQRRSTRLGRKIGESV